MIHQRHRVDIAALYASLDAARRHRGLSWRELGRQALPNATSSTFTRLKQGHYVDLETFACLIQWLRLPAESFFDPPGHDAAPDLAAGLAHLVARSDIPPGPAGRLAEILEAAIALARLHPGVADTP